MFYGIPVFTSSFFSSIVYLLTHADFGDWAMTAYVKVVCFQLCYSLQQLQCLNTNGIFALLHILLVQNAKTSQSITSFLDVFYYLITGWARPQGKEGLNGIGINSVLDFNFSKGFDGSFVIKSSRNTSPYFQRSLFITV